MSKYYCVSNIVFTSCHPVLIDSHANRKCRAETLTESHVKKHIPADEVGVVLPPCILIRVRHIYDVCTALTISRCCLDFRSQARPSEQSWMAFLLPLTRLVCQHYCAYGQCVPRRPGCAQTRSTSSWHLCLRRHAGEAHTCKLSPFLPSGPQSNDFSWQQQTCHSWLRDQTEQRQVKPSRSHVSLKASILSRPTGRFTILSIWRFWFHLPLCSTYLVVWYSILTVVLASKGYILDYTHTHTRVYNNKKSNSKKKKSTF